MTTASTYSNLVQELYVSYFGRPADAAGLVNFENALLAAGAPTNIQDLSGAYATNAAVKSLIDSFGTSAESVKLYGAVDGSLASAEAFVTAVFEHVLNRAPAAAGLTFWAQALMSGSVSFGNAALSIAAGAQANTTAQGKLDGQTIANKLAVASEFTAAVADPAGLAEYRGSSAAAVARTLLAGVDNTTDLTSYAFNVQGAVVQLPGTGTPYTLTTSVDSLTGTGTSNVFNAVLDNAAGVAAGGPAATLNTGDTITGAAGAVNTLSINDQGGGAALAIPKGLNLSNITNLNVSTLESVGLQDFSTWSGLNSILVSKSSGSAAITLGSSTSLWMSDTGAPGSIGVTGGSKVTIATDSAHSVTVKGGAGTTSVTIDGGSNISVQDGSFGGSATNTLASVSLLGPSGTSAIESMALTSLLVSGDSGHAVQVLSSTTGSLALGLDADSNVQIDEDAQSVALTSSGTKSSGIDLEMASGSQLTLALGADLALSAINGSNVSKVAISGAGNLTADFSALGSGAVISAANSTGAITATIGQQQSFTGGSGVTQLTTTSLPTATLDGGTGTGNQIDFQNVTVTSTSAFSTVKDFATWEISGNSSGTFNLANASGVKAFEVLGIGGNLTVSHLDATAPVTIDLPSSTSYGITLGTSDTTGSADNLAIALGSTSDPAQSLGALTLQDNSGNGIGTLTLTSNAKNGAGNTIGSLADANLQTLTLSGNAALTVSSTLTDSSSALAIANSAGKSVSTLAGLTDNSLSTLTISGSEAVQINALASTSTSLTLTDSGSAAAGVASLNDTALTSLSINGGSGTTFMVGDNAAPVLRTLNLGAGAALSIAGDTLTSGITVSGTSDNAAVIFTGSGATASSATDSISLGSGSDQITLGNGVVGSTQSVTLGGGAGDTVTTGTVGKLNVTLASATSGTDVINANGNGVAATITVGSGSNHINLTGYGDSVNITAGGGANQISTGIAAGGAVSFSSHTAADTLDVSVLSTNSGAANLTVVAAASGVPAHVLNSLVVTGLNANGSDSIVFSGTVGAVHAVTSAEVQSAGASTASLAGWLATAAGLAGIVPQSAGGVSWFQEGGNTYLVYTAAASDNGTVTGGDSIVELTGTSYTFGTTSISSGGALLLNGGTGGSGSATYTLTTGTDSFTGTAATNNFVATLGTSATLNTGDTLTGGSGDVNILGITDSGTGGTMAIPGGASISGMTVLNIASTEAVGGNYSSWTGLGVLNVTASVGVDNITAGSGTAVSIVDSGTAVDVTGGKSVLIKDTNYGTATANTLATVALTNLSGAATVDSNALTSLTVNGSGYNVTVAAAAATRTLAVTVDGASGTVTDATATTANLSMATQSSSQEYFSFAAATSIAVTDAVGLNDSQTPWSAQQAIVAANATSMSISGAGLFAANLTGLNAAAVVNASSATGEIDLALSTGQGFTGGAGKDVIATTGTPTANITGGSNAGNEFLLLNAGAADVTALAKVNDFATFGVSGSTSGTFDLSQHTGSTIAAFDVNQDTASANISFTKAHAGSTLSVEGSFAHTIALQTADSTGVSDTAAVTLGSTGGSAITVAGLQFADASAVGTGTVAITSLANATVTTLVDTGLTALTAAGAGTTTVGTIATGASTLTLNSTGASLTVTAATDNGLSNLVLEGSSVEHIGTLSSTATTFSVTDSSSAANVIGSISDSQLTGLTLSNSGGSSLTLTSALSAPLTSLTLSNSVAGTFTDTTVATSGITVSGASDNAAVSFSASDATASGVTDSVTLGNGNDTVSLSGGVAGSTHSITLGIGAYTVTDGTAGTSNIGITEAAGKAESVTADSAATVSFTLGDGNNTVSAAAATTVSITAGAGSNTVSATAATTVSITAGDGNNSITATAAGAAGTITVGAGANTIAIGDTGALNIVLGSHTGVDAITVGVNASNSVIGSITGAQAGDTISFGDAAGGTLLQIQDSDVTANSGDTSVFADWVSAALAGSSQHQVAGFVFGGNTYLVEQSASGGATALTGDTVIELIGTHTLTGVTISGHVVTLA